jgi:uncharacterized protein (TIRG00374 family)
LENRLSNNRARLLLTILISAIALWWFAHDIEWASLTEALTGVRVGWVAIAAFVLLGEFWIRALRWSVLLRPLGTQAKLIDLAAASVIGAGVNTLVPLRAGEIAKPVIAARRTGYPLSAVIATNVMERVFDLLGMVSILLLMVAFLPGSPGDDELVTNLQRYGALFGALATVCLGIFFVLATRQTAARSVFERILSVAPAPVQTPFLQLFDGFVSGLGSTRDLKALLQAAGLSIVLWVNGAMAIYLLFIAFSLPLPFAAACFTGVAIALTVALPQAPGFIGVFHIAIEKTLVLWGIGAASAKGFAIVFWAVSFVPVTTLAVLALWREGLSLGAFQRGGEE